MRLEHCSKNFEILWANPLTGFYSLNNYAHLGHEELCQSAAMNLHVIKISYKNSKDLPKGYLLLFLKSTLRWLILHQVLQ